MTSFAEARVSRRFSGALFGITIMAAGLLAACEPSKPAEDASGAQGGTPPHDGETATVPKADEEAPKWDATSETANPPPSNTTGISTTGGFAAAPAQRRSDEYDKEETNVVLARAARQVKANCGQAKDEDGNAKGPWGSAAVSVTLGHNGHTRGVTIAPPYDAMPAGKCAVNAFLKLTFPPWSGADATVDWPVEFVQPGKAAK